MEQMIAQRIMALALGYKGLRDYDKPHHDPLLQTAAPTPGKLASPSTLCGMENQADRQSVMAVNERKLLHRNPIAHLPKKCVSSGGPTQDFAGGARCGGVIVTLSMTSWGLPKPTPHQPGERSVRQGRGAQLGGCGRLYDEIYCACVGMKPSRAREIGVKITNKSSFESQS